MNRIFSVALVYCDKMCAIPSLGAKEEIKNILDSGGFFKGVQQYLQNATKTMVVYLFHLCIR